MPPPTRPCPFCSSTRYVSLSSVSVEVATKLPTTDRFAGTALVCRGCGHVDYFIEDVEDFIDESGATDVDTGPPEPYR